ncbi:MAG: branched-chain amino acid ABC transporter permease [Alphaproteobacteria bacterium]
MDLLAQQFVNGLSIGMGYVFVALGLTLIFGILRVINFAHGELYMLGGLFAVLGSQQLQLPYAGALAVATILVAGVAWAIDRLAVRPLVETKNGHSTVLLSTFAVSLLLYHGTLFGWGPAPRRLPGLEDTATLGAVTISHQRLLVLLAGLVLLVAIELMLRRTHIGKEMRAVAQNSFAARVVGIDVARVGTSTYVIAGALAGMAGALLTPVALFTPLMGQHVIIKAFVVVVIGGMGSITGAVVCGLGLGVLEAIGGSYIPSGLVLALIYSLMIVALLVRPRGLFGGAR